MKQEEKRGFVWIDWLIICALLIGGALVAVRVRHSVRSATATQPILYTLAFSAGSELAWETWEMRIPVGAAVTTANGTALLGEVVSLEQRPIKTALVRDGRVVFTEMPDRVQLVVTVRANAVAHAGDGLRVGDIRIAADGVGDFRLGGYLTEGSRILSVRREA